MFSSDLMIDKTIQENHLETQVSVIKVSRGNVINYNYLAINPGNRNAIVVDPAWEMEKLQDEIIRLGVNIIGVLITHSHDDHINLAREFSRYYSVPIWISSEEVEWSGFGAPDLRLTNGTKFLIGGIEITPILTPGHTPGCVCYHIGDNIFTGDVLFAEGCGVVPSINSAYQMYESLDYLKNTLSPRTRVFPGHSYGKRPGQIFSDILRDNIYLQFSDKETFAAFRLRSGQRKAKFVDFS